MKVLTHIDCPKEWESENDWDSHRPLLYLTLENSYGGVVEFGAGDGSTKLINEFCSGTWRDFVSFDNNKEWCKRVGSKYCEDYLGISIEGDLCVVFIDAAPAEIRKELIKKWNWVHFIVIHDTEEGANYVYGMSEILSTFKYRIDYRPEGKPHTTAVSNFIDVTKWVE